MKRIPKTVIACFLTIALMVSLSITMVFAAGTASQQRYYLSSTAQSVKKDHGFTNGSTISNDDPHFGWSLGKFYITGFSDTGKEDDNTIFFKTVGDELTLSFALDQNIDKLNKDESLSIGSDKKGYDEYFGVEESDFGRGTLIVRYTDYENLTHDAIVYNDYLTGVAKGKADTKIKLAEEGDYEIALDYEIKNDKRVLFGKSIAPSRTDYRIFCKFSVRNGNTMIYPFDVKTKAELSNGSITENGFYLDTAKSRYLNLNIKKEILKEGATGLTEDTRFNKVAKDGEQFTDEGIYTITATNRYTNETTTKKIYVGTNDVLKAFVSSNLSIEEIQAQLANGATVDANGTIIPAVATKEETASNSTVTEAEPIPEISVAPIICIVIGLTAVIALGIIARKKSKKKKAVKVAVKVKKKEDGKEVK